MGNDSHQPSSLCQVPQCLHCKIQRILIQGAKALVHKHGVQAYAACRGLDFIGQPQGQGQGCLEGLAAGQCPDTALRAVVMVNHIQPKAAFSAVILFAAPLQLILASAHHHEPGIGACDNPFKIRHLDICLKCDFFLSAHFASSGVGQGLNPSPLLLYFLHGVLLFQYPAICGAVGFQAVMDTALFLFL